MNANFGNECVSMETHTSCATVKEYQIKTAFLESYSNVKIALNKNLHDFANPILWENNQFMFLQNCGEFVWIWFIQKPYSMSTNNLAFYGSAGLHKRINLNYLKTFKNNL